MSLSCRDGTWGDGTLRRDPPKHTSEWSLKYTNSRTIIAVLKEVRIGPMHNKEAFGVSGWWRHGRAGLPVAG